MCPIGMSDVMAVAIYMLLMLNMISWASVKPSVLSPGSDDISSNFSVEYQFLSGVVVADEWKAERLTKYDHTILARFSINSDAHISWVSSLGVVEVAGGWNGEKTGHHVQLMILPSKGSPKNKASMSQCFNEGCYIEADFWLNPKRSDVTAVMPFILADLVAMGKIPINIGTSEEELERLYVECNIHSARFWLGEARSSLKGENAANKASFVRDYLTKAGKPLSYIGTSEKELKALATNDYSPKFFWLGEVQNEPDSIVVSAVGRVMAHILLFLQEYILHEGESASAEQNREILRH